MSDLARLLQDMEQLTVTPTPPAAAPPAPLAPVSQSARLAFGRASHERQERAPNVAARAAPRAASSHYSADSRTRAAPQTFRIYRFAAKDGAQHVWQFVLSAEPSSDANVKAFQYRLRRAGQADDDAYGSSRFSNYNRGGSRGREWIREFDAAFVNELGRDVVVPDGAQLKLKVSLGTCHFVLRALDPHRQFGWQALQRLAPKRDFVSRWSNICDLDDLRVRALVRKLESKLAPSAEFKEVLTVHIDCSSDGREQCRLKYHRVDGRWELLDRNAINNVLGTYDVLMEDAVAFRVRVSSKLQGKPEVFSEMASHVEITTPPGGDFFDTTVTLSSSAPQGHIVNSCSLQQKAYVVHGGLRFLLAYLNRGKSEVRVECRLARPQDEGDVEGGDGGKSKSAGKEPAGKQNAPSPHAQCQVLVRRLLAAIGRS